jgi:hypothetical protein
MGGVFFLFRGSKLNYKKNTKIKYNEGHRWPPFDILHAKTNQKHVGMTEGGWDRPHNCVRTLGERDGNKEPLAKGNNDNKDNEYNEDSNIAADNYKYAFGIDDVDEPLDKGDNKYDTLSAAPTRACPESQWLSVPSR